jgi:FMN reductase
MSTTHSTTADVVVLVGNPRPGSRTRAVAEQIAALVTAAPAAVFDLADLTGVTYSNAPAIPARPDETAIDQVRAARVLIVASPSYKGTYTGLLKLFLDRLPHRGLDGVVALPVGVARSSAHAEATAADLSRLLSELGARVSEGVALLESQLDSPDLAAVADALNHAVNAVAG